MLQVFLKTFQSRGKKTKIALGILLVIALGAIDYHTGPEWSFSSFYLLPIALVTWCVGLRWGLFISAVSGLTWLAADMAAGHIYTHLLTPYWNMLVRLSSFVVVTYALSELRKVLDKEKNYARQDFLTGAANSRNFMETAQAELQKARAGGHAIALAYIDLDNFKGVNDTFGHSVGDQLLKLVAEIIKKNLRDGDMVARLGGDEFAVLLPRATEDSSLAAMKRMKEYFLAEVKRKKWPVSFSMGLVLFKKFPDSVDEMIKRADNLMYTVKDSGKDDIKFVVYR
ncbi:MAG: GGDEF domain-containing protein [Candidatus Edwardsbacteria bacterium]|nr:GGDEF domain-containing protein [Candidatus Edwardsbacteria bacterium]MBU2593297.1 GGDEF domain-containing protein [Candidatus Edwardsbacteria bacterium]